MPLNACKLPRGWQARLLAFLAAILLLTQTQGLVHGVVHGGLPRLAHPVAAEAGGSWLLGLFLSHDGESDCRLYDQCSHADALLSHPAAHSACHAPSFAQVAVPPLAPSLPAALPRARGPPASG